VSIEHPRETLQRWFDRLAPVPSELVPWQEATGRVLAEAVRADRDSPSCDVSAMDGYAVRVADVGAAALPIAGEVAMGQVPPEVPAGRCVRVFTGGAVPREADAVIQREHCDERPDAIHVLPEHREIRRGQNIRRQGENIAGGTEVLPAGTTVTPAVIGALATFGTATVTVRRRVRVTVINTGSELVPIDAKASPQQVRDSNGPVLHARLTALPQVALLNMHRVNESPAALREVLDPAIAASDAVWLTGGVSMGDHDSVPDVVRDLGGDTVFHRLAIRPGKPILGAVMPDGTAVLGLPGNPVSVLTMSRVFGEPLIHHLSGAAMVGVAPRRVDVRDYHGKQVPLWWYRPARLIDGQACELVRSMGSGDVVGAATADGYIEVPPNTETLDTACFWMWS